LERVKKSGAKSDERDVTYWLEHQQEIPADAREYVLFFPGTLRLDNYRDERMQTLVWNHTVWVPSLVVLAIFDAIGCHPNVRLVR